jgi:FkbM family methyltransferase
MSSSPDKLQFVDVGCSGGLQDKWLAHVGEIVPVMFDANASEASKLRAKYQEGIVIESGLSDIDGPQELFITRNHKCISLLEPNFDLLSGYRTKHAFELTGHVQINCSRYDTLYKHGKVPAPDAIKIDVQGYEYQVLSGFGILLSDCLAIELEAHFYPIYIRQKLLHELTELLSKFDFVLRRLTPSPNFEGDLIEVDAFFTKRREFVRQLEPIRRGKFNLITEVWNLPNY